MVNLFLSLGHSVSSNFRLSDEPGMRELLLAVRADEAGTVSTVVTAISVASRVLVSQPAAHLAELACRDCPVCAACAGEATRRCDVQKPRRAPYRTRHVAMHRSQQQHTPVQQVAFTPVRRGAALAPELAGCTAGLPAVH